MTDRERAMSIAYRLASSQTVIVQIADALLEFAAQEAEISKEYLEGQGNLYFTNRIAGLRAQKSSGEGK